MERTITVESRFQGPTGSGQGGYTAALTGAGLAEPFRADFHARIPLDVPLTVSCPSSAVRELDDGEALVLRTTETADEIPVPPFVPTGAAETARAAYPAAGSELVPECFSCGIREHSLQIWAGPVGDGTLFATTWTPPDWTAPDGAVAPEYIWAVIDCPAGAKTCFDGPEVRSALTGSMTAEVVRPVTPGMPHVIVAWADQWKGRRRVSGAAMFTAGGTLVARQHSMWIALG